MERYRPIIDDWSAFEQTCGKPALKTVRRNSIKAGDDFEERLRREFEDVEQSGWNPNVYRLKGEDTPGKSLLHWRGEYYVQEESAAVPVDVMDPQKGENILDMAAAPGGKATQIASRIENRGSVIANDSSGRRMKSLHANVYRTGSACITATNYDGRQIPEDQKYSRILVDAPCSGEGDRCRRDFDTAPEKDIEGLSELQKQLMEKASSLLQENGSLVYSTCTITPRENEEVVKHVLENTGLELKEIDAGFPHQRGVPGFEGKDYGEEMSKTVRVYPHHLDSGVIYTAKFSK